MTGETITAHPRPPLFTVLLVAAAVALAGAALAQNDARYAVGSLPLWLVAAALHVTRPRPLAFTLTDTALEVAEPPQTVPYADMEGLLAGGKAADPYRKGARRFAIHVIHPGGVLEIPARLDVPSDEVYRFLYRKLPARTAREVHPDLAGYLRHKEKTFGSERVWAFGARTNSARPATSRRARAVAAALLVSGAGWIAYGSMTPRGEPWLAFGIVACILSGLFWVLFWSLGRQQVIGVKGKRASLVIAPDGLAVLQGDLRGELRWDELLDVKLRATAGSFRLAADATNVPGILLKVAGASIVLTDVYDRPLPVIHQHLCYYWRGEAEGGDFDPAAPPRPDSAGRDRLTTDRDGITAGDD